MRILIVGTPHATHVGWHLWQASREMGEDLPMVDINEAYTAPRVVRTLFWRLLGHRPVRLRRFSAQLVRRCAQLRPDLVLTLGIAPVDADALTQMRAQGTVLANFLTDDPWNPEHRAPWFKKALPLYHHVFTPRHANEPELRALFGPEIHYLPFGYAPEIHFPPQVAAPSKTELPGDEILFIGNADADRTAIMSDLHRQQLNLSLWGDYWNRHSILQSFAHGHAGPEKFRQLVSHAAINLCLVRRANRDGHSMRSFELPAIGGCMLVEDTADHRRFFGTDGECVRYFSTLDSLVVQAKDLLASPEERAKLRKAVHQRICAAGHHTYADRLRSITETLRP